MGLDIDGFVSKVVDTGKDLASGVKTGLSEAGNFVAKMVQDDTKDAIKTARMVGLPGLQAPIYSQMLDKGFRVLGWNNLADETNPDNLSTTQKAGSAANTLINAASLVPGLGAGIKATQAGIKSSKYMKGGAKMASEAIKGTVKADVSEKKLVNIFTKLAEDITPGQFKGKFKDAVADESLKYVKELKKGISSLADKPALQKILGQQKVAKEGYPDVKNLKNLLSMDRIPPSMQRNMSKAWDQVSALRDASNFLGHAGKITLNKGIRTGIEGVKQGFKAGRKQFLTQAGNTWRKSKSSRDSDEDEKKKKKNSGRGARAFYQPLGNNGPITKRKQS